MKDIFEKFIMRNSKRIPHFFEENNYALIGKLSGSILHDVLTPLTSLTLANENQHLSPNLMEPIIQNSRKELREYLDILKNIMHDNKTLQKIHINEEIRKSILLLKHKIITHNINLQFIEFDQIYSQIYPIHIYQIIINLISNAIEGSTDSNNKQIILLIKKAQNQMQIECRDFGCGIPQHILKNIGKDFTSTKSEQRGFGLYSIHYTIQKILHGTIHIETEEKNGTLFVCKIPIN